MKFIKSNATILAVVTLTSLALFEQFEPAMALRGAKLRKNHDVDQKLAAVVPQEGRALQDSSSSSDSDDSSSSSSDDSSSSDSSSSSSSSSDDSSSSEDATLRVVEDPFAGGDFRASEVFFPGSNQAASNNRFTGNSGGGNNSGHSGPGTRKATP